MKKGRMGKGKKQKGVAGTGGGRCRPVEGKPRDKGPLMCGARCNPGWG